MNDLQPTSNRRRTARLRALFVGLAILLVGVMSAAAKPAPAPAARKVRPPAVQPPAKTVPKPAEQDGSTPSVPQMGLPIEGAASVPFNPLGRRVEFDAVSVFGQTKAAGAVYLFERQFSELPSMVKRRQNYRPELQRLLKERSQP